MIGTTSTKYAVRSLTRHTRRTILSMIGVGIGCAMGILAGSWVGGSAEMQLRAVAESGAGHLRVVPDGWTAKRDSSLRLADGKRVLETVSAQPGVRVAAPRARVTGLLAVGNRTVGLELVGVAPEAESLANRLVRKGKLEGRYLRPDDKGVAVIGSGVARRLKVELDDDLYVTMTGANGIESAMLTVIGILETGSRDLDTAICHVTLHDLEGMTGRLGIAEISLLLDDPADLESLQLALAEKLPAGNEVVTWKDVNPSVAANVEGDTAFTRVLIAILVLVVTLGIASAQLTAVLERRREFAVLSAIGMKSRQVMAVMALEAAVVGLGGAAIALLLGGSSAYWLATHGVSMEAMMGGEISFGDVLLDPYMYGTFGPWIIWYALGVSVTATLVASLYPAFMATRVDPVDALRTA